MNTDNLDDFARRLADFQPLPLGERSTWHDTAAFGWVPGITWESDDQSSDTNLVLTRAADWMRSFPAPLLDYVVELHFQNKREPLSMSPQTAIDLGTLLIIAGSTGVRDLAENAAFLTQTEDTE